MAIQTIDTLRRRLETATAPSAPTGPETPTGFGDADTSGITLSGFGGTQVTPVDNSDITDQDVAGTATRVQDSGQTGAQTPSVDQDVPAATSQTTGAPAPTATQTRSADGVTAQPQPSPVPAGFNATSVADQLDRNLRSDSTLMRRADTIGRQIGNRRGVLNSSITAGAAMNAAYDAALPVAQQDASQAFQSEQAAAQFGYAGQLSAQEAQQRLNEAAAAFGYTSQLSEQEAAQRLTEIQTSFQNEGLLSQQQFQQNMALSDQEFEQQMGLSRQDYQQQLDLQERRIGSEYELAMLDAETRQTLLTMESNMQTQLAEMNIDAESRQQMTAMITSMHELYQESLRSTLSNPDISAEDRNALLQSAGDLLILQTAMIEDLYGVELDWVDTSYIPTTSTDGSGDTGGTAPSPGNTSMFPNTSSGTTTGGFNGNGF